MTGSYKSDKPNNKNGSVEVHLKCDCINGSIVNGTIEHFLFIFGLTSPRGHEISKKPRIKLFKRSNRSVLPRIHFYVEDDDHEPVFFNGETISFTCQLVKN